MNIKENEYVPPRNGWHRAPMIFFGVFFGTLFMIGMAFLFGYVVMLLWNWLMPALFHIGTIGYWQAVGIIILCKLLFGMPGLGRTLGWKRNWQRKKAIMDDLNWGSSDVWEVKGGWQQWRYYKDYWRSEGKKAFEKYVDKLEKGTGKKK